MYKIFRILHTNPVHENIKKIRLKRHSKQNKTKIKTQTLQRNFFLIKKKRKRKKKEKEKKHFIWYFFTKSNPFIILKIVYEIP